MQRTSLGNNISLYAHPLDMNFYNFIKTWKKPDFQRSLKQERLHSMIEKQNTRLKLKNEQPFLILGTFELCRINKQIFLIDGQHRKEMLVHFFERNQFFPEIGVSVKIKELDSEEEMFEWFQLINESTPVELFEKSKYYKQAEYVSNYIAKNYKSSITDKEHHHCNRIHLTRFCNFLTKHNLLHEDWNMQDTEKFIDNLNQKLKKKMNELKITLKQKEDCNAKNCYLGLYVKFEKQLEAKSILYM